MPRSMVINQFKMKAYKGSLIEPVTILPSIDNYSADLANDLFKDTYAFSFIDKENTLSERDLEKALLDNMSKFILELTRLWFR